MKIQIQIKGGDLKYFGEPEQFSWHHEFHFSLGLNIFVCHQK